MQNLNFFALGFGAILNLQVATRIFGSEDRSACLRNVAQFSSD